MRHSVMLALQLSSPPKWHHHHHYRPPICALSKQGQRLLISIDTASAAASHRLIRKFVASSSKSVALDTLSHLLSSNLHRHSSLALPMYESISKTPWFIWNSKLVANLIASLEKQGCTQEAEILVSDSVQKLNFREPDVALFYCDLIESFSKIGSHESVFEYYSRVKQTLSESTNSSTRRRAFGAMISALCTLDLPLAAEEILEEMQLSGIKPSKFDFRLIVLAYGRLRLFQQMTGVLDQMESSGYSLDTISFNIVLSCYGSNRELSQMVTWIRKMKSAHTPFSIRTYNTVLNSCPTLVSLLQDPESLPLSMKELVEKIEGDEAILIRELIASSVLGEILEWSSSEGKLDLHGMHLGAVYVIMLQWIEELRSRFRDENATIPTEIMVVCGLGKHSNVRGESPVKGLVSGMMVRLGSPMRLDRKNVGCFVAKGKNVKNWLCFS